MRLFNVCLLFGWFSVEMAGASHAFHHTYSFVSPHVRWGEVSGPQVMMVERVPLTTTTVVVSPMPTLEATVDDALVLQSTMNYTRGLITLDELQPYAARIVVLAKDPSPSPDILLVASLVHERGLWGYPVDFSRAHACRFRLQHQHGADAERTRAFARHLNKDPGASRAVGTSGQTHAGQRKPALKHSALHSFGARTH